MKNITSIKNIISDINSELLSKPKKETDIRKYLRKHPKNGNSLFSKDELIAGYRKLFGSGEIEASPELLARLRMKPTRTLSGVATVTVLTKPYPCPGNCIFCPDIKNMPKSYLPSEPGAQRAVTNKFDPYLQTYNRIKALYLTGHTIDKIELIIIGGTWNAYPEDYQLWFVNECFRAMNEFDPDKEPEVDLKRLQCTTWGKLYEQHKINETTKCRCVGLSFETRPDCINEKEVIRMRKLGATKVQIGVQSLDDEILKINNRQHTVKDTKRAFRLLRLAGFKIHIHWMVNLHGSTPEKDIQDYKRLWEKDFRPDEVKIYPTSIIKDTKLHELYVAGQYNPYTVDELKHVLKEIMKKTPRYCRLTRVVRDIPSPEIVSGSKVTNLRQVVEKELIKEGNACECIRCREIKGEKIDIEDLALDRTKYETSVGKEIFFSYRTKGEDKLVGFLRLFIPDKNEGIDHFIDELDNSAIIREIHVYGEVVGVGKETGKSQHIGIGEKLIDLSKAEVKRSRYKKLSVISAVGTREYYRKRGFVKSDLYQKQ